MTSQGNYSMTIICYLRKIYIDFIYLLTIFLWALVTYIDIYQGTSRCTIHKMNSKLHF